MALQVTNYSLELKNGLSLSNFYIRLSVGMDEKGDKLRIDTKVYLSKEKYQQNSRVNLPIKLTKNLDYVREHNGIDLLRIAHNTIKEDLESAGVPTQKITFVDIEF